MNKQELTNLITRLMDEITGEPAVKASDYKPADAGPVQHSPNYEDGDFVEDVSSLDLRKLYLVDKPQQKEAFARLKEKTPARLGCGKAGPRYKTLTMLRFRADHAAAQDAVFSQMPDDYGEKNNMVCLQTRCADKDQYLTRPDLGRCFDEENIGKLKDAVSGQPKVQIVVGDGLSSAAILANAEDCIASLKDGLKLQGIETGRDIFVRYCRVGAGDAVADAIGCQVVCVLVGERPGLVTDKSMSAYITYKAHTGISESSRTVVSNIHGQGTPAVEAGAHIAQLIGLILEKKVSGVGLHLEESV